MAVSALTLDGSGISIRSFREIREALVEKFTEIFGKDIDLSPSSPDGQLLDLFAYSYSDVAEAVQGAAAALDVSSAEGTFLDSLGRLMGISRRDGESDEVYRSRLLSSEQTGLATYDGMLTYLRKKIGASVSLSANEEPYADAEGIPGHSVSVYVPDSLESVPDGDIAQAIWDCKPAGIRTFGSSGGTATDIAGNTHVMNFTRIGSTSAYYARIVIAEYEEETLPQDYADRVAESVAGNRHCDRGNFCGREHGMDFRPHSRFRFKICVLPERKHRGIEVLTHGGFEKDSLGDCPGTCA